MRTEAVFSEAQPASPHQVIGVVSQERASILLLSHAGGSSCRPWWIRFSDGVCFFGFDIVETSVDDVACETG